MEQLSFFWGLLMQATASGFGLAAAAVTALVLLRHDRRRTARLLVFPAIWIMPLVLGGVFAAPDKGPKTADWLGYISVAMLAVYVFAAVWCLVTLRDARWVAVGCLAINAPLLVFSAFVLAMASGGTWV